MSDRQAPQSYGFTAGETVLIEFTADGDVTGAAVHFWMARARGDTAVLSTEAPLGNAVGAVTDTTMFTVSIADEETEELRGTYAYDVELQDVFGNKTKAAYGFLTFARQVEDTSIT